MKKIFALLLLTAIFVSCNAKEDETTFNNPTFDELKGFHVYPTSKDYHMRGRVACDCDSEADLLSVSVIDTFGDKIGTPLIQAYGQGDYLIDFTAAPGQEVDVIVQAGESLRKTYRLKVPTEVYFNQDFKL